MIASQMDRVYFPIQLNELKATIRFRAVKEETLQVFDGTLSTIFVNHPTFALGFRVSSGGKSVVYIADNEPFDREVAKSLRNVDKTIVARYLAHKGDPNQRIFDFCRNADVLIHDTTYTPEEYVSHVGWGHSHYLFTLKIANEAAVKKVILFHHEQNRTDDRVEEILQTCVKEIKTRNYRFECLAAEEGMVLEW
jgi:ribonuclease BN (tRNA processing enzyme)